jgi:hypothetical protein
MEKSGSAMSKSFPVSTRCRRALNGRLSGEKRTSRCSRRIEPLIFGSARSGGSSTAQGVASAAISALAGASQSVS